MNDTTEKKEEGLFRPGKARWLQESGNELTPEQRALLLAMAQLESELGRELSPDEQAAIAKLSAELTGYDSSDITRAVKQVVETPTDPKRRTDWSELRRK